MDDLHSGLALWTSEKVVVKESDTLFDLRVWWPGWLISLRPSLSGHAVYLLSYLSPSLSHLSRHCSVWREGAVGRYLCTRDPLLPMEYLQGGPGLGHVCAHSPPDRKHLSGPDNKPPLLGSCTCLSELSWAPLIGETELSVS